MLDESILKIMATREKSKVKPLTKIFQGAKAPNKSKTKCKHSKDNKPVKKTCNMKKKSGY